MIEFILIWVVVGMLVLSCVLVVFDVLGMVVCMVKYGVFLGIFWKLAGRLGVVNV